MSITLLRGLPGTGKSSWLIETVNAALAQGRPALTFACSDSPWLKTLKSMHVDRMLTCRRPGLVCPLNHFVSTVECAKILSDTPAGTLLAFDESYWFSPEIVPHWIEASRRGLELLIVWPSEAQLQLLEGYEYTEIKLAMPCQRCAQADASMFVYLPNRATVFSICESCRAELTAEARREIRERLWRQSPHPGKPAIFEPLPLEEYAEWQVTRADSLTRAKIMKRIFHAVRFLVGEARNRLTYLDVGCGTGYFCHYVRRRGFYYVEGVDAAEDNIAVAKLLDSFFLRDNNVYKIVDYLRYLRDTQDRVFDVTSGFNISTWLLAQRTNEDRVELLERLFAKTKQVCFLDLGCSARSPNQRLSDPNLSRSWLLEVMEARGGFSRVLTFEADENSLQSDLFVGLKISTFQVADEALERLGVQIRYPSLIPRLRKTANAVLPPDATVLVISRGDDALLDLYGRRTWHFPRTSEGWYAGHHPADSTDAVAHLESLRACGANFLLVPATELWWLEYYEEFSQHLERHYQVVVREEDTCVIFALRAAPADTT